MLLLSSLRFKFLVFIFEILVLFCFSYFVLCSRAKKVLHILQFFISFLSASCRTFPDTACNGSFLDGLLLQVLTANSTIGHSKSPIVRGLLTRIIALQSGALFRQFSNNYDIPSYVSPLFGLCWCECIILTNIKNEKTYSFLKGT